jgi:hypothetical protein
MREENGEQKDTCGDIEEIQGTKFKWKREEEK